MEVSSELEQLWHYLCQRAAWILIYRVVAGSQEAELEFYCGTSAYDYRPSELAAIYKDMAVTCCKERYVEIMAVNTSRPPNCDGRRWRSTIIAGGAAQRAGYVIVTKVLAIDDAEMSAYIVGIQRVMGGEEARNVPRPGGWLALS